MKHTTETIHRILQLNSEGLSSREIAHILGIGKSSVNNAVARNKTDFEVVDRVAQPFVKAVYIDIEVAPSVAAVFGRWKQNIGQANVIEEGGWLLTASYKWLGSDETHVIAFPQDILNKSDFKLCKALQEVYNQADAVIAHNAPFDHKMIQTRCLINNLPTLKSVKVIDTLAMAKKNFRFNSNKLDSLGEILGFGGKVSHDGMKMWLDVMFGDLDALDRMKEYNARDVDLLEQVYLKLRGLGHQGTLFNAGLHYDDSLMHCNVCGSDHVAKTGNSVYTALSEFSEYECLDCGNKMRDREAKNSKEQRKNLLTSILN